MKEITVRYNSIQTNLYGFNIGKANLYSYSLIYVYAYQIFDGKMQYIDEALGVSGSIPVSQTVKKQASKDTVLPGSVGFI